MYLLAPDLLGVASLHLAFKFRKKSKILSDTVVEHENGGLGDTPSLISSTYGKGWGLVTINTALHLYYSEGGQKGEPIKGELPRCTLLCAPGLVKFVPAVSYLLCMALPGSYFANFLVDLCSVCKIHPTP